MTNDMSAYKGNTYKMRNLPAVTSGGEGVSFTGNAEVTDWHAEDREGDEGMLPSYCTIMPISKRGRVRVVDQLTCDPYDLIAQIAPQKAGEDSAADAGENGHR